MFTLQQTVRWAQAYIEYAPLTAGTGNEPAVSIANMVRNIILNAPFTWPWNRATYTGLTITTANQDYVVSLTDFGYLEKVTLTDPSGNSYDVKDIINTDAVGAMSTTPATGQRPNACAVLAVSYGTNVTLRFMGYPDQTYTANIIYQKLPLQFGSYSLTAAGNASAGNTTYTGIFTPSVFPAGSVATISGFLTAANNGDFAVVSCSTTQLVVSNASGTAESAAAAVFNGNWTPIPDSFIDIFNALFLSDAMLCVGDVQEAAYYRQRGALALIAKAEGLTEMQKNEFLNVFLMRDRQTLAAQMRTQMGVQAKAS